MVLILSILLTLLVLFYQLILYAPFWVVNFLPFLIFFTMVLVISVIQLFYYYSVDIFSKATTQFLIRTLMRINLLQFMAVSFFVLISVFMAICFF
jgi:hypothetical protein